MFNFWCLPVVWTAWSATPGWQGGGGVKEPQKKKGGCTVWDTVQLASSRKCDQTQTMWLKGFFQTARCWVPAEVSLSHWPCQPSIRARLYILMVHHLTLCTSWMSFLYGFRVSGSMKCSFSNLFQVWSDGRKRPIKCREHSRLKIQTQFPDFSLEMTNYISKQEVASSLETLKSITSMKEN